MKLKFLILFGIMSFIVACSTEDEIDVNVDGVYVVTFQRNQVTSNVKINLNNGEFLGESNKINFPAIYQGSFSVDEQFLNFNNQQQIITTEFDPNLILNGLWSCQFDNDALTMTNSIGDVYTLIKE